MIYCNFEQITTMEKLEEIKESLAKEKGFADYSECLLHSTHSFGDLDSLINELVKHYSKNEIIKAYKEGWADSENKGLDDYSAEKIHENAQIARKLSGKPVRADYVSLDTDLSLKLAEIRSKKTGREVPKEVLLNANKAISKEFPDILKNKSFDELYLWDTNENGNPRLILTQINGVTKMYDKNLYERFLKKAKY